MPQFEEYSHATEKVPFVFRKDIIRTPNHYTKISNWHEDIEIEYFKEGEGLVVLDGEKFFVQAGDFIFVKSNEIHQLIPYNNVKYDCLIIDFNFCQKISFSQKIKNKFNNEDLSRLFSELEVLLKNSNNSLLTMKLYSNIINQLIVLDEQCVLSSEITEKANSSTQEIKNIIKYIRDNFFEKLTLDEIANKFFINKFILSRKFKKFTNTTIIEYINMYRCKIAAEKILNGASVSSAAYSCGYENLSYFIKTFKRYYNCTPNRLKRQKI